jgi:hypothetical protein
LFIISEVQKGGWGIFGDPNLRNRSVGINDATADRLLRTERKHYLALSKSKAFSGDSNSKFGSLRRECVNMTEPEPDFPPYLGIQWWQCRHIIGEDGCESSDCDRINSTYQRLVLWSSKLCLLVPIGFYFAQEMLLCFHWDIY